MQALGEFAPVTHVEGNNDESATGEDILRCELFGIPILLTHILPRPSRPDRRVVESLREQPAELVIFGHSHLPHLEQLGGVTFFNPASAGPRRFDYPVSAGLLERQGVAWTLQHVALDDRSVAALQKRMNQMR
jgi:putative phosphoesterase